MNRWNKYLIHKSHYKMEYWLIAKNYKTRSALPWAGMTEPQAISTHRFLEQNSWNASELRIRIAILILNSGPKSTWTYPLCNMYTTRRMSWKNRYIRNQNESKLNYGYVHVLFGPELKIRIAILILNSLAFQLFCSRNLWVQIACGSVPPAQASALLVL